LNTIHTDIFGIVTKDWSSMKIILTIAFAKCVIARWLSWTLWPRNGVRNLDLDDELVME